ncbi:MAG: sodium ion-translocating decarboxylase subunit beta, partial [Clostridia bacterium]|nr:sodium ion-translocating decarboxylase subunit beta [Clostridia bacterium]
GRGEEPRHHHADVVMLPRGNGGIGGLLQTYGIKVPVQSVPHEHTKPEAAGISAFPMSGRVVHKMALEEDPNNFILMQAIGVNVSGQVASVIAGGLVLNFFMNLGG